MADELGEVQQPRWSARAATALVSRLRIDWPLAAVDVALACTVWIAAVLLRYDLRLPPSAWDGLWSFLPIAVAVTVACNAVMGMYRGVWRYASIHEAKIVLTAQLLCFTLLTPVVLLLDPRPVPLSTPLLAAILGSGLFGLVRFQSRFFALRRSQSRTSARIVVVGAGTAGAAIVRDVHAQANGQAVVALVDDDPRLRGRLLLGVRITGTTDDLQATVARESATQVVLAIPSAAPETVRRVAALAELAGVSLRVVPPLAELVGGTVSLQDVRDLEISDLLGRAPVTTDLDDIAVLIRDRRVLVTGGGGSIGSEIARQVAALGPASLTLLDHDETHLFDAAADLPPWVVQCLADVRDAGALRRAFDAARPQLVFHAAAHKHVPLLEEHPVEAVRTNVLGTRNVLEAARAVGVERFVFISTDKAVSPRNVMGASKRVGEQLVLSQASPMSCCAVRFGNVLGSRGSVVPTFMRQIRAGGPVTITDARMTRYFMSIPEAVRLVLHAAALSEGREIFMLDMGEPVRIVDLASRMIRLSGQRPGVDVEIRVTGVRPGEKIHEVLHASDEVQHPTSHPAVERLDPVPITPYELADLVARLETAAAIGDGATARQQLWRAARTHQIQMLPTQRASSDSSTHEDLVWI